MFSIRVMNTMIYVRVLLCSEAASLSINPTKKELSFTLK